MALAPSAGKQITFSSSFTLPVTRRCLNRCFYCGFREDRGGILRLSEVEACLERARRQGSAEVLVIAGERAGEIVEIRENLQKMGFADFPGYAAAVCRLALRKGFLPHTNIGTLDLPSLTLLREVNASMGLMLENADPGFGRRVHPQKTVSSRQATIEEAGRLRIPFTTGILVGLGEPPASRIASLAWIAEIHLRYGHIQEVILQNYVPNRKSRLEAHPLTLDEWLELIRFCRERMPGVKIQIPPNLNPFWSDLVSQGLDDLGGISVEIDYVNPHNRWDSVSFYRGQVHSRGFTLTPRLPLYREYYRKAWFSGEVKTVLDSWIQRDEFRYYCQ
jgi:7,8-didemethyl-8-hydroxy-5-deazariboflavin synthase CofG subunit